MRIAVLGSEGCLASGFVGLVDILSLAQRAIADSQGGEIPFEIITASADGRPVRDGHGRRLEVDLALRSVPACDAFIIPGFVPDDSRRPRNWTTSGRPRLGSVITMPVARLPAVLAAAFSY